MFRYHHFNVQHFRILRLLFLLILLLRLLENCQRDGRNR